ncbi:MAG: hypothetical protein Q4A79_03200 [Candidatus Saccharibacteria bacterium]|nr:hypothetical protein [Candidatus Saccharibacteria bacterium]
MNIVDRCDTTIVSLIRGVETTVPIADLNVCFAPIREDFVLVETGFDQVGFVRGILESGIIVMVPLILLTKYTDEGPWKYRNVWGYSSALSVSEVVERGEAIKVRIRID